ncbi:uncharacterized protein LOC111705901 isoform X2 [Eurytemora carolleeae]|nr:uncharacterized protein LOC111705901 isoform X2 [Eurytemora carolleeae]|eukprot:XP_023334370.1 uncharacterized protein LOC111705901 isoform X2 [Eurytemora affinis]
MSYYHRWAACIAAVCIERNTFTKNELDEYLGLKLETKLEPSFSPGSLVRIKMEDSRIRWRKPHLRVPGYIFGSSGEIIKHLGNFPNPEQAAFYTDTTTIQPLYLVQLRMNEVWKNYPVYGDSTDLLTVEVYEPWLELQNENSGSDLQDEKVSRDFPEHHVLDHGDHVHDDRKDTEVESVRREECEERKDEYGVVLSRAVLNLLVSKGLVNRAEVQASIEKRDKISGLNLGQRIVVKAWMDPEFKVRLLEDGNKGVAELGLEGSNPNAETKLVVVENTDQEHHVVVCTLCSCYPSAILGLPPAWYKSRSYRARTVREPRKVLFEFGLEISPSVRIVVHDSTADCRYLVLPVRPEGTEGLTQDELEAVITMLKGLST